MVGLAEFAVTTDDLLPRICRKLQIAESHQKQAEAAYSAIANLLESNRSPVAQFAPRIYPQGSLRLGTTVRPRVQEEFDLDIVCELGVDPRLFPNPPALIDAVYNFLREQTQYHGIVTRKNRCVRVSYAGRFHLDILPGCPDPLKGNHCILVPDRAAKSWKPSNPKGYASWFDSCCESVIVRLAERAEPIPPREASQFRSVLKLVTQLLKRWRDMEFSNRHEIAPISVVLTTLAGLSYSGESSITEALVQVVARMANAVPSQGRLFVLNPANEDEDLSERWGSDANAYQAFVGGIRKLRIKLEALLKPAPLQDLAKAMRQMFGEDVANQALLEHAEFVEQTYKGGSLSVTKHSGVLTGAAVVAAVPVVKHTFYGDEQQE